MKLILARINGLKNILLCHKTNQINAEEITYLTTQIQEQVQLQTRESHQVITQENIFMLLPMDRNLEDCIEAECEVDIGRILGKAMRSPFIK